VNSDFLKKNFRNILALSCSALLNQNLPQSKERLFPS